ncbi:TIGR02530 family flagellar biosynthesis protein [Tissierella sp.]|uniref:TIGR02530 family flagellar biosynthesis protein n=1 Tax=Tissierella sp. TaxID=41274 RepID=UPI00285FF9B8|nr:TIGR02530 family flagellar biosynthesis protein [Tissierella sp.]MDR7856266.1 TIGR02530 family flagellar biosynthesis protein [Tissierella sp.]
MNKIDIRQLENRLINSAALKNTQQNSSTKDFNQILERIKSKDEQIKFSKHAVERLNSRNVNLSTEDMNRLETAIHKAKTKGVKEALILLDDKAFIASVNSKTIITTVNREQLKDNVFTNIDGAVII